MRSRWLASVALALSGGFVAAETPATAPPPPTRLEEFALTDGAVIVRGSSVLGVIRAGDGGRVIVEGKEFSNLASGTKVLGVAVTVKEGGSAEHDAVSYVDDDEIGPLVKGLEVLAKLNASASRLDRFGADYRTRGGLVVSVFTVADGFKATVAAGTVEAGTASVTLNLADLEQLRGMISDAKRRIDSIR